MSVDNYGFDPSKIIKVISENHDIGLALVQIPINIVNSIIGNLPDSNWKDYPTIAGYYWLKWNGHISIKEYSSTEINAIISMGNPKECKYCGPLKPPE